MISGFVANLIFSGIGFVAFVYGKKMAQYKTLGIGLVLMAFPYFVESTLWLWVIGVGLTIALFVFRE